MSFEMSDEQDIVELCIEGFQLSTHIACHCYVEEALDTLVDSFAKFTRLRTVAYWAKDKIKLKTKNFRCTQALVECAIEDRNFLKGAWPIVLEEISALEKLDEDKIIVGGMASVQELFNLSSSLDMESIVEFTRAMVLVARSEIACGRHFMLRQLQEVAEGNMNRIMWVWKDIWLVMSRFFSTDGCSTPAIAERTVGIILYLARRFLSREEMAQFHFQEQFLQPFIDIMERQTTFNVQDLIVDCIEQIVSRQASVLHSAWTVVFQVLNITFSHPKLAAKGVRILRSILADHLTYVKSHFGHLVTVVNAFVSVNGNVEISCKLIEELGRAPRILTAKDSENWIELFETFSQCVHHRQQTVRVSVEKAILLVVAESGCVNGIFSPQVWRYVFERTLPALFQLQIDTGQDRFPTLLADLFQRIFEPHLAILIDHIGDIFGIVDHCCTAPYLQTVALTGLLRLVRANPVLFSADPNISLLQSLLTALIPRLPHLTYLVEVLADLANVFSSEPSIQARFIALIDLLAVECSRHLTELQCLITWCSARFEHFQWLLRQRHDSEAADHFRETLALGLSQPSTQLSALVTRELSTVASLTPDAFAAVTSRSDAFLADYIEFGDAALRATLAPFLAKRLSI
jgi:hypothetical protein